MTWQIDHVGAVTSTMDVARERARGGAPEGLTIVADAQTAGRGRRGRSWFSQQGVGVFMTTILKPTVADVQTLGPVVGAATLESLIGLGATAAQLKWPNDVLIGRRKLAGILLEAQTDNDTIVVLAGVGINLRSRDTLELPDDIAQHYIGLEDLGVSASLQKTAAALAAGLHRHYDLWISQGLAPSLEIWSEHDALAGVRVRADGPDGPVEGIAGGLDASGGLKIDTPDGPVVINSGEIHRVLGNSAAQG